MDERDIWMYEKVDVPSLGYSSSSVAVPSPPSPPIMSSSHSVYRTQREMEVYDKIIKLQSTLLALESRTTDVDPVMTGVEVQYIRRRSNHWKK